MTNHRTDAFRRLAVVGMALLAASALANDGKFGWRESTGRPAVGGQPGIYVWHEGNQFHILSVSQRPRTLRINVDVNKGTLINIKGRRLERNDDAYREARDRADFTMNTRNSADEATFMVRGGNDLKIEIREGGKGKGHDFYVGTRGIRTDRDTIHITLGS